jgi:hypothetical protein
VENFVSLVAKGCGYPLLEGLRLDPVDKQEVINRFFHSYPHGYQRNNG